MFKSKLLNMGWNYDFSTLSRWNNHDNYPEPYITDHGVVSPNGKYLYAIYSVIEVSMGHYCGFLAILENKENPKLLLDRKYSCYRQNPFFISDSIIMLYEHAIHRFSDARLNAYIVYDCEKKQFAFVPYRECEKLTRNFYNAKITKINDYKYNISPLDVTFDIRKLTYYPFEKMNSFRSVTVKKGLFGTHELVPFFEITKDSTAEAQ